MSMNKIHQDRISTDVDWLGGKLRPLRDGKSVCLTMYTKGKRGKFENPLITITPGQQFGMRREAVVVSVINIGSCIVEIDCKSVSRLIMAGIPAGLARVLFEKLQFTLREVDHGNRTTKTSTGPRARYTERATRWASTRKSTVSTASPRDSGSE